MWKILIDNKSQIARVISNSERELAYLNGPRQVAVNQPGYDRAFSFARDNSLSLCCVHILLCCLLHLWSSVIALCCIFMFIFSYVCINKLQLWVLRSKLICLFQSDFIINFLCVYFSLLLRFHLEIPVLGSRTDYNMAFHCFL